MVVFCNHQLGPSAELFVSDEVARTMLREAAAAARPYAEARWEIELVLWLDSCADAGAQVLEVGDIAWTPDHFAAQRTFVVEAIQRAARCGEHALAFDRWRRMVEAHPADAVQVGRRWQWPGARKAAESSPQNRDLADTNLS
jgi:hypothetical protein